MSIIYTYIHTYSVQVYEHIYLIYVKSILKILKVDSMHCEADYVQLCSLAMLAMYVMSTSPILHVCSYITESFIT